MTPTIQSWLNARAAGVPPALMEQIRAAAVASFGEAAMSGGGVANGGATTSGGTAGVASGGTAGGTAGVASDGTASGTARVVGQREGKEELDRQVQEFIRVVADQLKQLRNRDCAERQDALDLLTVDALLTYALELVASVRPDALDRYAIELMRLVGGA
jgi:hypothetical protein